MAKATGLSSQFRGKIGNVIGYLSKNRAGKYEQTVKAYQPVVANPQSYAQALSRVPVGPVQRICSALLPIVQRGFEGVAYGDPSKSYFLSYNLKNFRGPYMVKGSVVVPPGPMMLSNGSLQALSVTKWGNEGARYYATFNFKVGDYSMPATRGKLSAAILATNNYFVPGEQLTFVAVHLDGGQYVYRYESLILNPADESVFKSVLLQSTSYNNYFALDDAKDGIEGTLVAAACIRSQSYGLTSFRRSTAFLSCNPYTELYNDETAVAEAVASYRTGEKAEDWQDDPTPEYQQVAYLMMVTITDDMIVSASSLPADGTKCLGYVTKGGDTGIFYKYSGKFRANVLIDANADIISRLKSGVLTPYRYSAGYAPARQYSESYGTMHN